MAKDSEDEVAERIKANLAERDDYLSSVQGLYAFASSACWDEANRRMRPASQQCIPRKMTYEEDDETRDVTPDCVSQVTAEYGVVAEMKKHFREAATQTFEQIAKYDRDLTGWWTDDEQIETHDLVLLTHYLSSTRAQDAYRLWQNKGNQFQRGFAIVEFTFTDQAQSYFALKRVAGQLTDSEHDERLRHGKPIPESVVINIFQRYKFYDADPPIIHMLHLLQDYVFPTLFTEEQYDEETGGTHPQVTVTAEEIRSRLEEQFCDPVHSERQPRLPKLKWVRQALEAFVAMELAAREESDGRTKYRITLRRPYRKDPVEYFTRKLLSIEKKGRSRKTVEPRQGDLFGESGTQSELEREAVEEDGSGADRAGSEPSS